MNRSISLAFLIIAAASTILAAPPKIVRTTPADGDYDVDPALTEVRIEFDQDMNHDGHSICGGGDWFPKQTDKPRWESARVFVMSIQLATDHDYGFNINCPSAMNFRNLAGESAVPYSLNFATRGGTSDVSAETHRQSFDELRRLIDDAYSYRDVRDVDWPRRFDEFKDRMCAAATPQQFGRYAGRLLAAAQDVHISVMLGKRWFAAFRRQVDANADARQLPNLIPNFKKLSSAVCTGRFDDNVGYILISTWNNGDPSMYEPLYSALTEFADCPGLIIDVRLNSGGNESIAAEFAGCFVDEPVCYATHVYRDKNAPGGFTAPNKRTLSPTTNRAKYRGKIAVLTGPVVMSSCEGFLLMMKTVPNCKLVGATSYGSSGNPRTYTLPNGVTVNLPSWKSMTPAGECFEGRGIKPDIPVDADRSAFKTRDPVIEAALKYLKN